MQALMCRQARSTDVRIIRMNGSHMLENVTEMVLTMLEGGLVFGGVVGALITMRMMDHP